eukprot:5755921-Pleurochrysis_carterae.AAC.1
MRIAPRDVACMLTHFGVCAGEPPLDASGQAGGGDQDLTRRALWRSHLAFPDRSHGARNPVVPLDGIREGSSPR